MTSLIENGPLALAPVGGADPEPPLQPLKRRAAASAYLREKWGVERAPGTLAKLAVLGGGPRFRKAGRVPLYAPADLDAWASELLGEAVASTSELKGTCPGSGQGEGATRSGGTCQ
jgi:hypothetical protein